MQREITTKPTKTMNKEMSLIDYIHATFSDEKCKILDNFFNNLHNHETTKTNSNPTPHK